MIKYLETEDFVDEDNGDIVTLYMAELKLCKCDDIEYKSLINQLRKGYEIRRNKVFKFLWNQYKQ
jgi:hypothetical protein